jgi:two-component sensor histidine kinase
LREKEVVRQGRWLSAFGARVLARKCDQLSVLKARLVNLEAELARAELASKETEHRSANALQLAAAALLSKTLHHPAETRAILSEAADRLIALAVVQRGLGHLDGDLAPGPVLEKLCKALVAQEDGRIIADVDCVGQAMPGATVRALGLIVNEAVTNAIKYGFPAGRRGRIAVRVMGPIDGSYRLEVQDDGVGLASSRVGVGSRFMVQMAAQIGGELRRASSPGGGVRLDLEFPAAP